MKDILTTVTSVLDKVILVLDNLSGDPSEEEELIKKRIDEINETAIIDDINKNYIR